MLLFFISIEYRGWSTEVSLLFENPSSCHYSKDLAFQRSVVREQESTEERNVKVMIRVQESRIILDLRYEQRGEFGPRLCFTHGRYSLTKLPPRVVATELRLMFRVSLILFKFLTYHFAFCELSHLQTR